VKADIKKDASSLKDSLEKLKDRVAIFQDKYSANFSEESANKLILVIEGIDEALYGADCILSDILDALYGEDF